MHLWIPTSRDGISALDFKLDAHNVLLEWLKLLEKFKMVKYASLERFLKNAM